MTVAGGRSVIWRSAAVRKASGGGDLMWPFKPKIEERQSGGVPFSDAVVEAIVTAAGGTSPADPNAIAALEAAASLYAAAFAAATSNAAVAFTSPAALPEATAALIREYRPSQVVIVGGSAAVTGEVRDAITQAVPDGASVRRITGSARTDTAARAARRILAGL